MVHDLPGHLANELARGLRIHCSWVGALYYTWKQDLMHPSQILCQPSSFAYALQQDVGAPYEGTSSVL